MHLTSRLWVAEHASDLPFARAAGREAAEAPAYPGEGDDMEAAAP